MQWRPAVQSTQTRWHSGCHLVCPAQTGALLSPHILPVSMSDLMLHMLHMINVMHIMGVIHVYIQSHVVCRLLLWVTLYPRHWVDVITWTAGNLDTISTHCQLRPIVCETNQQEFIYTLTLEESNIGSRQINLLRLSEWTSWSVRCVTSVVDTIRYSSCPCWLSPDRTITVTPGCHQSAPVSPAGNISHLRGTIIHCIVREREGERERCILNLE